MRVFLSSTVYDLIDVRAELYEMFKEMGMDPVMSDVPDSNFEVLTDKNSIETCLVNLEKSDSIVFVLSQRYGPSLAKVGFGDYSATHLEYRRAVECCKPIYMYVRDRLEADYAIWKKVEDKEKISFAWVDPRNVKLFELLKQHSELSKDRPHTNWYKTFRDSVELKKIVKSDFKFTAAKTTIKRLLSRNEFPLLVPDLNVDKEAIQTYSKLIFRVQIKNAGGAPAFNFVPEWLGEDIEELEERDMKQTKSILPPGDKTIMTAIYQLGLGHTGRTVGLSLSYSNADGYRITELYDVKAYLQADTGLSLLSGCVLKERKFEVGKPFEVDIQG